MKSFSEDAARTWTKEHVRDVLELVMRDINDLQNDLRTQRNEGTRRIWNEKLDDLREERDFLEDLLR